MTERTDQWRNRISRKLVRLVIWLLPPSRLRRDLRVLEMSWNVRIAAGTVLQDREAFIASQDLAPDDRARMHATAISCTEETLEYIDRANRADLDQERRDQERRGQEHR
jgi:hypothetical protein